MDADWVYDRERATFQLPNEHCPTAGWIAEATAAAAEPFDWGRVIAEKDAQLAQQALMLREVNHRVQNSLQLVSTFLALHARRADDSKVAVTLGEAQQRVIAVAHVHRQLFRAAPADAVDLAIYLRELLDDIAVILGPDWAAKMSVALEPIVVAPERAIKLGLVLAQLVMNARAAVPEERPVRIAVSLAAQGDALRLLVSGAGIPHAPDTGYAERMMDAMVEGLAGTLTHDDGPDGARSIVTAPIAG